MAKRRGRPPKAILGQTKVEEKKVIEEVVEAIQEDAKISVPEEIVVNHNTDVVDVLEKAVAEEIEKEVPAKLLAPESEESEEKVIPEIEEPEEEIIPEPEIEVEFDNDPIEIEIPEEPVARMLTAKEHKRFLRTGKLPF